MPPSLGLLTHSVNAVFSIFSEPGFPRIWWCILYSSPCRCAGPRQRIMAGPIQYGRGLGESLLTMAESSTGFDTRLQKYRKPKRGNYASPREEDRAVNKCLCVQGLKIFLQNSGWYISSQKSDTGRQKEQIKSLIFYCKGQIPTTDPVSDNN